MNAGLTYWTVFFLAAASQGFFLAVMIALRKSRVHLLLAALIASFSLCLLFYVSFWTGYYACLPEAVGALQGLTFLFGPICYFYIRSDRKDIFIRPWHFIPFVGYVLIFVLMEPGQALVATALSISQNLHLLIYSILIFRFLVPNVGLTNGALKLYRWRQKVSWAFAGYTVSFFTYYILVWTGTLKIEYDYMISVASSFFIYFIGYHGFHRQEVFKMYEQGKYDKSGLSPSASRSIHQKLKVYMAEKKPYLASELRLQDLASQLELTPNYLSQVINDLEEKNFADFINEYRIEEAQSLLKDLPEQKIIEIAYRAGFNTKASFNSAFKKFTGVSPSQFRQTTQAVA